MSVNLYNATTDTLKNVAGDIINPKSVNEMIAPVEDGTASKAYAVGEQFIMNDLLCEATQAIAQGDTMVIGTNCEESEQLSKQVKDIKSDLTVKGQLVELYTGTGGNFTTPIPDDSKYLIVTIRTPNGGNTTKFYPTELIRAINIHESAYWTSVEYGGYDVLAIYDITKTSIIPIVFSHGANTGDISVEVMSIS